MGDDSLISQIGTVIFTLAGIALILYLAYISTKFLGRRMNIKTGGSRKLQIIDSVSVGKDKSVMIVRAGEKTFLIGAAQGGINLISELDSSEFEVLDIKQDSGTGMDFKTAFKTVLEKKYGKKKKDDKENDDDSSQTK